MPFLAERLYLALVRAVDPTAPDSVHLCAFPKVDQAVIDQVLVGEMHTAKQVVSLGHAARNAAKLRVRQPLAEAAFGVPSTHDAEIVLRLQELIADELNVKAVRVLTGSTEGMVNYRLKPVDTLGKDLRGDFPPIRKMLTEAEGAQAAAWGRALLAGEKIALQVNGKVIELDTQQVIVYQSGAEGYAVAEGNGYLAALKTALSAALVLEGLAREVVRRVQTLRKDADLAISDRITVSYQASEKLAAAIQHHAAYITAETLADHLIAQAPPAGSAQHSDEFDGEKLTLGIVRQ
jgi:isoleucyl-tRNA synthetase